MDTLDFFRAILPDEGVYYLALIDKKTGRVAHRGFQNFEDLTLGMAEFDKRDDLNVYHACASYKEPYVEVDGKRKYRIPENWHKAKSFWIDLDCGEDKVAKGDGYITKRAAAEAIHAFCKEHSFPLPMFVDSGNGVHCYWPLTKAISPEKWKAVANVFKAVLAETGVLADPTCTADFSRILRPVGSHNKKRDPKEVKAVTVVEPIDPQLFVDSLKAIVSKLNIKPEPVRPPVEDINDDLTAHMPVSIPCSIHKVADNCQQVAMMRDTQGDVGYDHWRGVIGLIKSCGEDISLAYEWSARRAETGHAQNDVDVRYNTWNADATSCSFFSKCNPTGCDGCPSQGKVKSPIILGRITPEPEAQNIEAIVDGEKMTVEIPALPRGYKFENEQLARIMVDKDGITHAFVFCNELFYPMHRIRKENGEYALAMRRHLPDGRTHDFLLDTMALASSNDLLRGLSRYEVVQSNNKDANVHLTAYMRDSLNKLKSEAEELNTLTTFGWRDNMTSFVIGDRMYHKDGTVRKVLVGGNARKLARAFPAPTGALEGYAHGLNYMYARPDMVQMQYAIASGFGSLLSPLAPSVYKGLLFSITGRKPGSGKTTVCLAMLNALGIAEEMKLATETGATENALNTLFSTYQNVPFLVDELTNIDPKVFSKLAYRVSQGKDRLRNTVGKNGDVTVAESGSWQLTPYVTANTDLHSLLAINSSDTTAEAVRVIQISVDDYPVPELDVNKVALALKQMELNRGAAGDVFLRYVVPNMNDVMEVMQKWSDRFAVAVPDQKFRFYRMHGACSMTAVEITNKLGITQFDVEALFDFAIRLINDLVRNVAQQNTLTADVALNDVIRDLSQRVITTYEYRAVGDARGPEVPVKRINGVPAGRYIIGNAGSKTPELNGKMFLSRKEVFDWCHDKRMNFKELMNYAQSLGILVPVKAKFTIGRGSTEKTGNVTCICIDINKLESLTNADMKLTLASVGNAGTDLKEAVS